MTLRVSVLAVAVAWAEGAAFVSSVVPINVCGKLLVPFMIRLLVMMQIRSSLAVSATTSVAALGAAFVVLGSDVYFGLTTV